MPRNEQRPIRFSAHALLRLATRGIDLEIAEWIVRSGATRPDADCDFLAVGTGAGCRIEAACMDGGDHVFMCSSRPYTAIAEGATVNFTYDPEVDTLMIHLVGQPEHRTRLSTCFRVPGGPVLDLAADGTVLAIEISGAARRYDAGVLKRLPLEGAEPIALAEAAIRYGVSLATLKLAAQRGRLAARKIGRNWTTSDREVAAYLASRQHVGRRAFEA